MVPCNHLIEVLQSNDPVASSIAPQTVGITNQPNNAFQFPIAAGRRLAWEIDALFTLGATGGFRFLANGPAAPTSFNAQYYIVDLTTPAQFDFGQAAEAAVANAAAVAGTYNLRAWGSLQNATAGVFAFQFAQNTSDVLPITILAGALFKVWHF